MASGASDSETITINAGPPAAIALSAAHDTVPSLSSTTITATVTDSNGNPAGAALTAATTSGVEVGEFSSSVFGTYTATYTAPMIDVGAQVAETVTVSTDGIEDSVTLNLLGEPPIDVDELVVRGTAYKEDGEIIADGVNVTVTVESDSATRQPVRMVPTALRSWASVRRLQPRATHSRLRSMALTWSLSLSTA